MESFNHDLPERGVFRRESASSDELRQVNFSLLFTLCSPFAASGPSISYGPSFVPGTRDIIGVIIVLEQSFDTSSLGQSPINASSLSEVRRPMKVGWGEGRFRSTFDRAVWSEPLAR